LLKAAKNQTNMLRLFFAVADCNWEEGKLKNIRLPTLTTELKNLLDEPASVRPTQLENLFQTIFNKVPNNKIDQLNPLHSHMAMTHFDKNSPPEFSLPVSSTLNWVALLINQRTLTSFIVHRRTTTR
jgi:hypothetical protein